MGRTIKGVYLSDEQQTAILALASRPNGHWKAGDVLVSGSETNGAAAGRCASLESKDLCERIPTTNPESTDSYQLNMSGQEVAKALSEKRAKEAEERRLAGERSRQAWADKQNK